MDENIKYRTSTNILHTKQ